MYLAASVMSYVFVYPQEDPVEHCAGIVVTSWTGHDTFAGKVIPSVYVIPSVTNEKEAKANCIELCA